MPLCLHLCLCKYHSSICSDLHFYTHLFCHTFSSFSQPGLSFSWVKLLKLVMLCFMSTGSSVLLFHIQSKSDEVKEVPKGQDLNIKVEAVAEQAEILFIQCINEIPNTSFTHMPLFFIDDDLLFVGDSLVYLVLS